MKLLPILIMVCTLAGCGTINTVFKDESVAAHNLGRYKTYCNSLPRIYSGAAYDFCILHAPEYSPPLHEFTPGTSVVVIDFALSGIFDTAVLPYTIYRQYQDGNTAISRRE